MSQAQLETIRFMWYNKCTAVCDRLIVSQR